MDPDAALSALAEPKRRMLLQAMAKRERTAGEVAAGFDITRQAVSHHLRVLLEAGLISQRREGTRRFYRARPEAIEELRSSLDAVWSTHLPLLKSAAEREQSRERDGRRTKRN